MLSELLDGRARVIALDRHVDERGSLVPFDFAALPLTPCRAFVVDGAAPGTARGGHAHRRGSQLLVRLSGTVVVELRFGGETASVELSSTDRGLLIGPQVWALQTYHGPDSRLLVFADRPYDPSSYSGPGA